METPELSLAPTAVVAAITEWTAPVADLITICLFLWYVYQAVRLLQFRTQASLAPIRRARARRPGTVLGLRPNTRREDIEDAYNEVVAASLTTIPSASR